MTREGQVDMQLNLEPCAKRCRAFALQLFQKCAWYAASALCPTFSSMCSACLVGTLQADHTRPMHPSFVPFAPEGELRCSTMSVAAPSERDVPTTHVAQNMVSAGRTVCLDIQRLTDGSTTRLPTFSCQRLRKCRREVRQRKARHQSYLYIGPRVRGLPFGKRRNSNQDVSVAAPD